MSRDRNRVFGRDLLFDAERAARKRNRSVKNENNPSAWKWKPFDPEKTANIKEIEAQDIQSINYAVKTNYNYNSKKRQKIALVFNHGSTSVPILEGLKKKKIKYFFLSFEQFIAQGFLSFTSDEKAFLEIGGIKLDLNDVAVVYWTPPGVPAPLFDFNFKSHPKSEVFFQHRWSMVLRELVGFLPQETVWIPGNTFHGSQEWQNKLSELRMAHVLGLNIPKTLLTNSFLSFKNFLKSQRGNNILLREFSFPPLSFQAPIIDTKSKEVMKDIKEKLQNSPVVFQQYVEKRFEYRVIILGKKCFPVRIYSQDSENAKLDWRVYDNENVKWERCRLPKKIENTLCELVKKLNLIQGSADLIESTDGKYYFLELNRPGTYYWLAHYVGLFIGDELAEFVQQIINSDHG